MRKKLLSGLVAGILLAFFCTITPMRGQNTPEPVNRNYVLIFWATEYNSKLGDAVEFFFNKMFKAEDQLTILTPVKAYSYSQKTRQNQTIEKLIEATNTTLKRDISLNAADYRNITDAMARLVLDISDAAGDNRSYFVQYRELLNNLQTLRKLNEGTFLKLAEIFKKAKGENYIYIFYQKEFKAIPERAIMDGLMNNKSSSFYVMELFKQENTKEVMDVQKVSQALKESLVILNFFYLDKNEPRKQRIAYHEFSGDIYNAFSKIANASGGLVVTTAKPESELKKIAATMAK